MRTPPAWSGRTGCMEVIGRRSITIIDGAGVGDGRLGGQGAPAADDQQRRAALAAGRLPLRPATPRARRRADAARAGQRRRRLELSGRAAAKRRRTEASAGERLRRSARPTARPRRPTHASRRPARRARRRALGRAPTLRILETRVLRGPNIWSRTPGDPHARRPGRARGVADATRSRASTRR